MKIQPPPTQPPAHAKAADETSAVQRNAPHTSGVDTLDRTPAASRPRAAPSLAQLVHTARETSITAEQDAMVRRVLVALARQADCPELVTLLPLMTNVAVRDQVQFRSDAIASGMDTADAAAFAQRVANALITRG